MSVTPHNATVVGRIIRTCDLYAQPIYIYYKKDCYYRTIVGGICAIVTGLLVSWYCITQIISLVNRDSIVQTISTFIDIENDPQIYTIKMS